MNVEWKELYHRLLEHNKRLKKQVRTLETILRSYLPIIETKKDSKGDTQ